MVGFSKIKIWNNKVHYTLEIKRRITIIKGDSATGKTTLYDLVKSKTARRESNCKFIFLEMDFNLQSDLKALEGYVVFIDEDTGLLYNKEFLQSIFDYDIRFVLITRKDTIINLPYSVDEVYSIHSSGKYHTLEKYYKGTLNSRSYKDKIITEGIGSDKDFFSLICNDVVGGGGNDKLELIIKDTYNYRKTYIVDSANFGRQMETFYYLAIYNKIDLILVESFEYMLLKSSMFKNDKEVQDVLSNTQDYVTSEFKTWENFYEYFLDKILKKYRKEGYSKSRLSECFYKDCCCRSSLCDLSKSGITNKVKDILVQNNLEYLAYPESFIQLLNQFTTNPTQEEIDEYYEMWRCNNL